MDNFAGEPAQLSSLCRVHLAERPGRRTGPAIEVDFTVLERVLGSLRELAHEFHYRDGTLHGPLLDSPIHAALRHAERDWHERRSRLATFVQQAADSLGGALAGYRQVDEGIATSIRSVSR